MTKINRVEVKGFKSFANTTEIILGDKFNCVIGANGSGKSNVSDMICFVLGRSSAKSLRAEKSANLIFNGGKKGDPAKEAHVSIFFDNSKKVFPFQEKEMNVTRRINQKGISTYILNGRTVTRQEILDLLSMAKVDPDGHNIISQGDIIQFTEMKTVERRELLEGIAGISMYEDKKQKALLELDKVDVKLNEAGIILKEREQYLDGLKKDRDQAIQYKELEEDITRNKATLLHLKMNDLQEKNHELHSRMAKYNQSVESIKKLLEDIQQKITEKKREIGEIDGTIKSVGEGSGKDAAKEMDNLRADIVRFESRIEVCTTEISKMQRKREELASNLQENDSKIHDLNAEIKLLQEELQAMKKEEALMLKSFESMKGKKEVGDVNQLNRDIGQLEDTLAKREREQRYLFAQKDADSLTRELEDTLKILSKSTEENLALSNEISRLHAELFEKEAILEKEKTNASGAQERIITDMTVKKFLESKQEGVHGPVMDLGKVDPEYALALNVAAGSRLKSIVVESEDVAKRCIGYLKTAKLGVLTFLPLNKLTSNVRPSFVANLLDHDGVIGLAVNMVSHDKKFEGVFLYVFGSTLVVKDLDVAKRIGIGKIRMVTAEGDLVETSGAMIGGYRGKSQPFGFKEKEIKGSLQKLEKELATLKGRIGDAEKRKNDAEERISKLREQRALLEDKISNIQKFTVAEEPTLTLAQIGAELNALRKKREDLKAKFEVSVSQIGSSQEGSGKERIHLREKIVNHEGMIHTKKNESTHIYLREKESLHQLMKTTELEEQQFKQELKDIESKLNGKKKELREKEKDEKRVYGHYKELFEKKNKISEAIQQLEMKQVRGEEKINILNDKLHFTNQDKEKIEADLIAVNQEFGAFKDVKLKKGISVNELNDQIRDFERMQKQMGNVNMKALEIYEKIKEEYQTILEKTEKLKQEKQDVLNMIQEIELNKKGLFMKTFNVIHENFKNIFSMISTKGSAHLEIEDEENVFNAGVDIKVKLTSKKYLDIAALSGGEKTLAALAFIFAIQEYQPAPFYLLDEVDAALDKNNSELLSKLVAKYSETAQYIVISHNDAIISNADQIYGVSMQEGVSKIVSLKV